MTQPDPYAAARHFHQRGQLDQARRLYRVVLQDNPDHAEARYLLGTACYQTGRYADAVSELRKAVALIPQSAPTLAALAAALSVTGDLAEALQVASRAVALKPDDAELHNLAGQLAQQLGDPVRAVASLRQAVSLAPGLADAHHNLAIAEHTLGRLDEAVRYYCEAIALDPGPAQPHYNLALALHAHGRPVDAIAALKACLDIAPQHVEALYKLAYFQKLECDWAGVDTTMPALTSGLREHIQHGGAAMIWPYALNVLPADATLHDELAGYFSTQLQQQAVATGLEFEHQRSSRKRLTIAYLSADFRAHAVGGLVYQLFAAHDREQVRVHAYTLLASDDMYQSQVRADADLFRDLTLMSPVEAARIIHADGADILVDLSGYTEHARPAVLALRPAPIQISWVGYLNTMRAPFVDYLFADKQVMTPALAARYSEAVVTLPDCFFPCSTLAAGPAVTRTTQGLRDDAFVFCSFNHSYKLDRDLFACWMQILRRLPNAQLWLYAGGLQAVEQRLTAYAQTAGVTLDRVVFAPRVPIEQHMARLPCADLFLDAFYYNAGATAISALQMGLPILTRTGERLLSRMGSSFNHAIGLEELNCEDSVQYVETAVTLATDRVRYLTIRSRAEAASHAKLFRIDDKARALEQAYRQIWQRYCEAAAPVAFDVGSD